MRAEASADGESERDLWRRARAGDQAASEVLVLRHQGLVHHVVRRLGPTPTQEMDDLWQVGALGLVKAIQRFDPDRGLTFATYAVPLILGELRRHLRDDQAVHATRSVRERAALVMRETHRLAPVLGREPTVRDLAASLAWDEAAVVEALDSRRPLLSLDQPRGPDGDGAELSLLERWAGPAAEPEWETRITIEMALAKLSERDRQILLWRFRDGETQASVGRRLGLSQVQVSRLERAALWQLRQDLRDFESSSAADAGRLPSDGAAAPP